MKVAIGILVSLLFINSFYPIKLIGFIGKYVNLFNYVLFLIGKSAGDEKHAYSANGIIGPVVIGTWVVLRFLEIHNLYSLSVLGSIVITLAGIYSVVFVAVWIYNTRVGEWVKNLGKESFSIYLLHMPVAGVIANLLNRSEYFAPLTVFRPLIVIFITIMFIKVYLKIFTKDIFKVFIGYRR